MERTQPYQTMTFVELSGSVDRMNLVSMSTISRYVFCTPRCYLSKSWEVGICNSYSVQFLVGGSNLTSYDLHVVMVLEQMQVFLQYLEIQEQTVGHFYLPDVLSKSYRRKLKLPDVRRYSVRLDCFLKDMVSYLYGGENISPTGLLATLNLMRHEYFNGVHTSTVNGPRSCRRLYHKVIGTLYGIVKYRLQSFGLHTRQYYGHMPLSPRVIYVYMR